MCFLLYRAIILALLGFISEKTTLKASLFLTPKEQVQQPTPLVSKPIYLEGIFFFPDQGRWIVWINGIRIESHGKVKSVDGWTVIEVYADYVVIQSSYGVRKEIFPKIMPDAGKD